MKLKSIALTGVLSLAGLGLIGVGAHAAFTTNTASSQTINSGYLSVAVSGSTGSCAGVDAFGNCDAWTLATPAAVGSVFDTTPAVITLTNVGTIPAWYQSITVSDTNNNSTFESELGMCEYSTGGTGVGHYVGVDSNGLLTAVEGTQALTGNSDEYVIQPTFTDAYSVDFYAGQASTTCGGAALPALTTGAEDGSVTVTISYNFADTAS